MAYIDKVTTLRRLALIPKGYDTGDTNGTIVWEGVDIEECILIKKVNEPITAYFDDTETGQDSLKDFLTKEQLEIVYQDPEDEEIWEPRSNGYEA